MKNTLIILIFLIVCKGFSQDSISYFNGDFDSALKKAKKINKNIFLITRSESCPVFGTFKQSITQDLETIKFLNSEFIVFEFNMDSTNEEETKRLKKYYHSWRGFPQIYFIDKNEKLISDINYNLNYSQKENLDVWRNYMQIESDWKTIKKAKNSNLTLENLKKFLFYREIKYSPYDLMQMNNVIEEYFKSIAEKNYSDNQNWILFEKYITIYSNPDLFDFVAKNQGSFQKEIDFETVSKYLSRNYYEFVSHKSEEDRNKLASEYPFNSIEEANNALNSYNNIEKIEPIFNLKD